MTDTEDTVIHPESGMEIPAPETRDPDDYYNPIELPDYRPPDPNIPVPYVPGPETDDYETFREGRRDIEVYTRWMLSIDPEAIRKHANHWHRVNSMLLDVAEMLEKRRAKLADAWSGEAAQVFLEHVDNTHRSTLDWSGGAYNNATLLEGLIDDVEFARDHMFIFANHYYDMVSAWQNRDGDELIVNDPRAPGWTVDTPPVASQEGANTITLRASDPVPPETRIKEMYQPIAANVMNLLASRYVDSHYYVDQPPRFRGPLELAPDRDVPPMSTDRTTYRQPPIGDPPAPPDLRPYDPIEPLPPPDDGGEIVSLPPVGTIPPPTIPPGGPPSIPPPPPPPNPGPFPPTPPPPSIPTRPPVPPPTRPPVPPTRPPTIPPPPTGGRPPGAPPVRPGPVPISQVRPTPPVPPPAGRPPVHLPGTPRPGAVPPGAAPPGGRPGSLPPGARPPIGPGAVPPGGRPGTGPAGTRPGAIPPSVGTRPGGPPGPGNRPGSAPGQRPGPAPLGAIRPGGPRPGATGPATPPRPGQAAPTLPGATATRVQRPDLRTTIMAAAGQAGRSGPIPTPPASSAALQTGQPRLARPNAPAPVSQRGAPTLAGATGQPAARPGAGSGRGSSDDDRQRQIAPTRPTSEGDEPDRDPFAAPKAAGLIQRSDPERPATQGKPIEPGR